MQSFEKNLLEESAVNMDMTILNSLIGNTLIPAAEEMTFSYVTAVVITGLSVVFLALIVLIMFVWAFGKIFTRKKLAPTPAKSTQVTKKPLPSIPKPQVAETKNDDDIIAVIAAAVAAMGESEGKKYRLRSVKAVKNKPSRSAWSMAGIQNNTNPF